MNHPLQGRTFPINPPDSCVPLNYSFSFKSEVRSAWLASWLCSLAPEDAFLSPVAVLNKNQTRYNCYNPI